MDSQPDDAVATDAQATKDAPQRTAADEVPAHDDDDDEEGPPGLVETDDEEDDEDAPAPPSAKATTPVMPTKPAIRSRGQPLSDIRQCFFQFPKKPHVAGKHVRCLR